VAIDYRPSAKFAVPRGYMSGFAIEIEWITSVAYAGDGLFVAHLVAPFATTDFYYQFSEWYLEPTPRAVALDRILVDAYYYNIVFDDFRPLPTIFFTRTVETPLRTEFVIQEPDYAVVAPIRWTFEAMPETYWYRA